MKKGFQCPKCGNLDAIKLLISTLKGKTLSLLLASQAIIQKSSGYIFFQNASIPD